MSPKIISISPVAERLPHSRFISPHSPHLKRHRVYGWRPAMILSYLITLAFTPGRQKWWLSTPVKPTTRRRRSPRRELSSLPVKDSLRKGSTLWLLPGTSCTSGFNRKQTLKAAGLSLGHSLKALPVARDPQERNAPGFDNCKK